MQNGQKKLDWIKEQLWTGRDVFIQTSLKTTRITPSNFRKWEASGADLFRVDDAGSLYMARGKRWDCIDYCRLTAQ